MLDRDALQGINERYSAVLDWWMAHIGGPYNQDHVVAIALGFLDLPTGEIVAILNRTLHRARNKPFSLRYFKVALEVGRGEFFKRQDRAEPRSGEKRSNADLVADILARQNRQGGDS